MKTWLVVLAIALCGCAGTRHTDPPLQRPDARTESLLKDLRQQLQSAIAHGDRSALERLLDPGFVFVHSTGKLEPRAEFIERMVAAAAAQGAPDIEFRDDDIRLYGDTAVWISHSIRRGTTISFVATDILVRRAATWKWVSVQSTRTDR